MREVAYLSLIFTETFNMEGNGESLAHGRIWSGALELLLPALPV